MLAAPGWRGVPEAALGLGLVVGACLTSFAALVVGALLRPLVGSWAWAIVSVGAVVFGLRELGALRFPTPENARLIPYTVFRLGPRIGSFQFGVELGSGVRTYVTSSLPYALLVAIALGASPVGGLLAATGFGLGRLLMTMASTRFNARYDGGSEWSDAWDRSARAMQALLCAAFVIALVLIWAVQTGRLG